MNVGNEIIYSDIGYLLFNLVFSLELDFKLHSYMNNKMENMSKKFSFCEGLELCYLIYVSLMSLVFQFLKNDVFHRLYFIDYSKQAGQKEGERNVQGCFYLFFIVFSMNFHFWFVFVSGVCVRVIRDYPCSAKRLMNMTITVKLKKIRQTLFSQEVIL